MARGLARSATAVPDLRVFVPDLTTHTLRLTERSPLAGRSIADSRLRDEHGVTVLAITRDGEPIGNPRGATALRAGDVLFVIGPETWDPAAVT
jgi:K+/H+ antiporter YhaU regulatory subunit KhtT